jgi:putative ABC transport system substrate-binding protein
MRRRDVIVLFGCATATWPFAARTQQQSNGLRRVVCLYSSNEGDPLIAPWMAAFQDGLQKAGWTVGRDLQIENRWAGGIGDKARNAAQDLIALKPDVIVVAGTAIETLLQLVHDVPVVFTIAVDPVGSGFIKRLSHPGGNVTGFMQFDYSLSAKWAELLKQVAPDVKRAGVIRDAATTAGVGQFAVIQSVAPSLGIEVIPIGVLNPADIERDLEELAHDTNGGLIVASGASAARHREMIVTVATKLKLPAVYPNRFYIDAGGLISYGADFAVQSRQAAGYVDRILKGEKPGDLPVQAPTKYDLVINLKAAKEIDLMVSGSLLARADEVVE